jgi:tRNA threonylcarbamoyl adenosine modification protein YeaZ
VSDAVVRRRGARPAVALLPTLTGVLVLALDTATPATTVALLRRGGPGAADDVLAEDDHIDARRHAEVLVPMVDAVVDRAGVARREIDEVVVGLGPGAYTGLRVGVATALGLGLALGVPVRGAITLDALAVGSGLTGRPFAVVTDARRREVFWARYDEGGRRVSGPDVGRPLDVAAAVRGRPVVGAGATPFAELFEDVVQPALPRARWLPAVADVGEAGGDRGVVRPLYLRRPDVTLPSPAGGAR